MINKKNLTDKLSYEELSKQLKLTGELFTQPKSFENFKKKESRIDKDILELRKIAFMHYDTYSPEEQRKISAKFILLDSLRSDYYSVYM